MTTDKEKNRHEKNYGTRNKNDGLVAYKFLNGRSIPNAASNKQYEK
jgi:hypothetical protein